MLHAHCTVRCFPPILNSKNGIVCMYDVGCFFLTKFYVANVWCGPLCVQCTLHMMRWCHNPLASRYSLFYIVCWTQRMRYQTIERASKRASVALTIERCAFI